MLSGFATWLIALVTLLFSTAVVGLSVSLINPITGLIAGGLTFLVVGKMLEERMLQTKVNNFMRDKAIDPSRRSTIESELRAKREKLNRFDAACMAHRTFERDSKLR